MKRRGWQVLSSNQAANMLLVMTCLGVLGYHAFGRIGASLPQTPEAVAREHVWPAGAAAPFDLVARAPEATAHLVLVVHSGCRYCNQEMPFYRDLVARTEAGGVSLHVAGSEDEATLGAYAAANGLPVSSLFPEATIEGLRSTPTVLMADRAGLVVRTWQGVMSERQKAELKGLL